MIHRPAASQVEMRNKYGNDFVPNIPLSPYVKKQFRSIKHADTGILNVFLSKYL